MVCCLPSIVQPTPAYVFLHFFSEQNTHTKTHRRYREGGWWEQERGEGGGYEEKEKGVWARAGEGGGAGEERRKSDMEAMELWGGGDGEKRGEER